MSLFSRAPKCPLFAGRFASYEEALGACVDKAGYETAAVVEQAEARLHKVIAACERDPVTCTAAVAYLLAAFSLPLAEIKPGAPMRVLDFGGGLGGLYLRLGKFIAARRPLAWDIVETAAMAEAGRGCRGGCAFYPDCRVRVRSTI